MILHELSRYYQRKVQAGAQIAPIGFEQKEIPFIIVIDEQGKFIELEDTRSLNNKGRRNRGKSFLVPKSLSRSGKKSYEVSNLLWDHYGYILAQGACK
mgnify:CR=1 FL=1